MTIQFKNNYYLCGLNQLNYDCLTKICDVMTEKDYKITNNYFNIRYVKRNQWVGQFPLSYRGFCEFNSFENCSRAFWLIMRRYRDVYHIETLTGIIERYAPACENNVPAYIDFVTNYILNREDVFVSTPLLPRDWLLISFAMYEYESGLTLSVAHQFVIKETFRKYFYEKR